MLRNYKEKPRIETTDSLKIHMHNHIDDSFNLAIFRNHLNQSMKHLYWMQQNVMTH